MIMDFCGFELAQQAVTVASDIANLAIGLVMPEWEATALGEVFGLVNETAAQAAGIDFLQGDNVEITDGVRDASQVVMELSMRQDMLPAIREVMAEAGGTDSDLDIVAEQTYAGSARVRSEGVWNWDRVHGGAGLLGYCRAHIIISLSYTASFCFLLSAFCFQLTVYAVLLILRVYTVISQFFLRDFRRSVRWKPET